MNKKLIIASMLFFQISYAGFFDHLPEVSVNVSDCFTGFSLPNADNICSGVSKMRKTFSKDLSIGGCTLSFGVDTGCYVDALSSKCEAMQKQATGGKISQASTILSGSSLNFKIIKGAAFKNSSCKPIDVNLMKFQSGMTEGDIKKHTDIEKMSKKYGLFSSSIDMVRDCMKTDGNACMEDGYLKLPKTSLDVKKDIADTVSIVSGADTPIANTIAFTQGELSKSLAECSGKKDEVACRDKILDSEKSPDAYSKKAIAKIELASSAELTLMERASRGDQYYIYRDPSDIKKLPIEVRDTYMSGVARQNAAEVLTKSLYTEIVSLKKSAVNISYEKAKLMAELYDKDKSLEILRNVLLEDQGKGGKK